MAYVNAIEYQSGTAMREAARAIHKRLWKPMNAWREPAVVKVVPVIVPAKPDRWIVQHNRHMVDYAKHIAFARYCRATADFGDIKPVGAERIQVRRILECCSLHFNIPMLDLKSNRRTRAIVLPRQIAMYIAKILTPFSFPEIGRRIGGRDHTTVLHAVRKVSRLIASDPATADHVAAIMDKIAPSRAIEGETRNENQ